jgi:acetyl esterase
MPLHPEVTALIAKVGQWNADNKVPPRTSLSFPEQRQWGRALFPLKKTIEERLGVSVDHVTLSTRGGDRPVRVYRPQSRTELPTFVFVHGGGYAVGGLDDVHHETLRFAASIPANVVAISYRLAPEHPWPAGIDDGEDILEALAAGAIPGLRQTNIILGGISAGAGLAVAVTRRLLGKGHSPIGLLVLMSPWLDLTQSLPSTFLYGQGFMLERTALDLFIEAYCRDGVPVEHPELSPARHPVPRGWPPVITLSAECDPLADDAAIYARRLEEAGVAHSWRVAKGMVHGFHGWIGQIPAASTELAWLDDQIRHFCKHGSISAL